MTSLSAYRTVSTPRVLPPMPVNPPPAPKLSMADDARRCNARLRTAWGQTGNEAAHGSGFNGKDHNAARSAYAHARNTKLAKVISALIQRDGPQTIPNIKAKLGLSESRAVAVLRHMREAGQVIAPPRGSKRGWALV